MQMPHFRDALAPEAWGATLALGVGSLIIVVKKSRTATQGTKHICYGGGGCRDFLALSRTITFRSSRNCHSFGLSQLTGTRWGSQFDSLTHYYFSGAEFLASPPPYSGCACVPGKLRRSPGGPRGTSEIPWRPSGALGDPRGSPGGMGVFGFQ